jgi:NADPH-dependent ferric siderophore reductase
MAPMTRSADPVLLTASAAVSFERFPEFLDPILEAIRTHDMVVEWDGEAYRIATPFGTASLEPMGDRAQLEVAATQRSALNRLKHALVGPICFIAASENPQIAWTGDETGPALPDDLRVLKVSAVRQLTPRRLRITFQGEDLGRYARDDQMHCRLIFQPKSVQDPQWPMLDDRGHVVWPQERKLDTRVYTIRSLRQETGEIDIDFAIHDTPGPATRWAKEAAPGDMVGILGPAAHGPKAARFLVLAGDETALPGVARILESLDDAVEGHAFIEVSNDGERQELKKPANVNVRWLYRDGGPASPTLADAVRSVRWPDDLQTAFFWGGCEHAEFRKLHRVLRDEVGLPRDRQTLHSHWHRRLSEEDIIRIGAKAYLP